MAARRTFWDFRYYGLGRGGEILFGTASGVPVFDEDGTLKGYRGAGSDITEIFRTEEAIKESEARLRDILETSPVGAAVVEHTQFDGQIIAKRLIANSTIVEMFGFSDQEQFLETDVANSWVDQDDFNKANGIMKNGGNINNLEVRRRRIDGGNGGLR